MSRRVDETESYKEQQKQLQNDTAIGEMSILMAQMQAQNDAAIGELSLIVSQMMIGGITDGV